MKTRHQIIIICFSCHRDIIAFLYNFMGTFQEKNIYSIHENLISSLEWHFLMFRQQIKRQQKNVIHLQSWGIYIHEYKFIHV